MATGMSSTYDLTVGVVVNMDEGIYMLSPVDTPLLTGMGADGMTIIGVESLDERQFSWMSDNILTPRSALAAILVTAGTVVTVTAGQRERFSTGDILYFELDGNTTEAARVTGYGTTADTLIVSRAWAGTAQQYATSSLVVGLGSALPEGSNPEAARMIDRVESTNVTQIFGPTKVDLSRTEQQVRKYGVSNEFARQLAARMKENAIQREQAYLYGYRVDSTSLEARTTGGLRFYITSNLNATATQLTAANIQAAQQTGYNAGGFADIVMGNPVVFGDLNEIGNTSVVRETIDDPMRGRTRVQFVDTEFGSVLTARNRWMLPNDAFGFSKEQVTRRVIQPLIYERLAKTGDSDQGEIVCEEGLEVKGQEHMFRFSALGYSGSN
jgi:hypothetical protein